MHGHDASPVGHVDLLLRILLTALSRRHESLVDAVVVHNAVDSVVAGDTGVGMLRLAQFGQSIVATRSGQGGDLCLGLARHAFHFHVRAQILVLYAFHEKVT